MNNRLFISLIAFILMGLCSFAQELPRFASSSFEGWVYDNPWVELTSSNISKGRIVLYVTSQGVVLTLTSPTFSCQDIDSINAAVTWNTPGVTDSSYDVSKTALTMAIQDTDGTPLDSVTVTPTEPNTSNHTLSLTLAVPKGLATATLRFVSWDANVVSSGAVKRIILTAIAANEPEQPEVMPGDVNGNGYLDIDDVTCLIKHLLYGTSSINPAAADVDQDGSIAISDVTTLIHKLLTGE